MDPFTLLTSGLAFNQKKNDKGLRAFGHSLRDTKDGPTTAPAPVPESENPMSHLAAHASELPQTNDPLEVRMSFQVKTASLVFIGHHVPHSSTLMRNTPRK